MFHGGLLINDGGKREGCSSGKSKNKQLSCLELVWPIPYLPRNTDTLKPTHTISNSHTPSNTHNHKLTLALTRYK